MALQNLRLHLGSHLTRPAHGADCAPFARTVRADVPLHLVSLDEERTISPTISGRSGPGRKRNTVSICSNVPPTDTDESRLARFLSNPREGELAGQTIGSHRPQPPQT